jgi:hypothetical protein
MKPGDIVSFDGEDYKVINFGPRNQLTPIPGVVLIGNAVIIEKDGKKILVYEWDLD